MAYNPGSTWRASCDPHTWSNLGTCKLWPPLHRPGQHWGTFRSSPSAKRPGGTVWEFQLFHGPFNTCCSLPFSVEPFCWVYSGDVLGFYCIIMEVKCFFTYSWLYEDLLQGACASLLPSFIYFFIRVPSYLFDGVLYILSIGYTCDKYFLWM